MVYLKVSDPAYECHLTCEPLCPTKLALVKLVADIYQFRMAKMYMVKGGEPSQKDQFMTARSNNVEQLHQHAHEVKQALDTLGIKTYRIKIEQTLYDRRFDAPAPPT